ncbi:hypothetical protein TrVE_jg12094 [Triparma verrucosa]|uniref:Uncharacterized protein n=1 Tax=Triparma verrucosa TaxID=1606542 RepID=A0A9W7KXU5_9STRA|nr:hypothetical protein TrVE_jg12094 [Triparma verrucosa]
MFVKSKPKMSEVGKDIFRKRRPKKPLEDVTNELEVRGDVLKEGENRPKWSRYDGNVVDERFDNVREKVDTISRSIDDMLNTPLIRRPTPSAPP